MNYWDLSSFIFSLSHPLISTVPGPVTAPKKVASNSISVFNPIFEDIFGLSLMRDFEDVIAVFIVASYLIVKYSFSVF